MHIRATFILVIIACTGQTNAGDDDPSSIAPAFSASELSQPPTDGWLTNGGDLFNRRFSPLTEINHDNVSNLQPVWRTHLKGSGIGPQFSGEAQPIIFGNVMYVITGANDVFALSVDSGEILWTYEAILDPAVDTICCGWTSRGVGLGDGKVFVGQLDGKLVALDQLSGEVVWSIQSERWQDGLTITSAPLYYDGLIITGFAGAEYGVRGRVKAYNSADGSLEWTFYTIPAPGEPGGESWPNTNDAWKNGGATVWQTPAVDAELGLLYFATGNPGPDFNGSVRPGDNLYSSSIVAIEARTGKYRWHFQQVHHDLWDLDSANPVVLFDIQLDGKKRKALVQVGKNGWAYILDRTNGRPLIGISEQPVMQEPRQATSPTQPVPIGDPVVPQGIDIAPEGFALLNGGKQYTPYWKERVVNRLAGTNWPPSAYDSEKQLLFVCSSDRVYFYSTDGDEYEPIAAGDEYYGGSFGNTSLPVTGVLTAMDMKTNRVVWSQRWPDRCYSGVAVTAGDLLFVGRNDGRFMALDSNTGMKLWEFQTDAGVNAPPSVFEYSGKQHVAVMSAGNLFAGSQRGDSIWLFALAEPDTETKRRLVREAPLGEADIDPRVFAAGRSVYIRACAFCHGSNGDGAHNGIALSQSGLRVPAAIKKTISDGRNQMPAFSELLDSEEIDAVARYVLTLQSDLR